ncbi:hypothetical protein BJ508DRAFT_217781, partial [Ascobolus immersus RN42]
KPSLDRKPMRRRKLKAKEYKEGGSELFGRIVWIDETPIRGNDRRGYKRISLPTYKHYVMAQFRAAFGLNFKGPCGIWTRETKAERDESIKKVRIENQRRKQKAKRKFLKEQKELESRPGYKRKPGRIPKFRWSDLKRSDRGGIDWYNHRETWLKRHLIPFLKSLKEQMGPEFQPMLMEAGAAAHKARCNEEFYEENGIEKLDWVGNSPDLNPIEKAWAWVRKRVALRKPRNFEERCQFWREECEALLQEQINQ